MKNKYRVVTDRYAGYEAQVRYWWFPFLYFQIGVNTSPSVELACRYIDMHRDFKRVVMYEQS